SGKTTYAAGLRADVNGILFSLDRWLITAFGQYSLTAIGHEEHTRRVLACRELIWGTAIEFLRRSVDVILDDGFFFRDHRVRFTEMARAAGARVRIHYVDTPLRVVTARLVRRNAALPPYNFQIDPETLQAFVGLFEPPSADEGAELVVVRHVPETARRT